MDCGSIRGCYPRCSAYRPTRCATPGCRSSCCYPTWPAAATALLPDASPPAAPVLAGLVRRTARRARPTPASAVPRRCGWLVARAAADTADALGWTARTLHRRSVVRVGTAPSVLRRVLRFRRAMALLRAGVGPAEVAARTGYADQPHLSRDVRAFAGVSPAPRGARHPPARARGTPPASPRQHTPVGPSHPQQAGTPRVGPSHLLGGWRRSESGVCRLAGEWVRRTGRQPAAAPPGSGANRSTPVPSGSRTVA